MAQANITPDDTADAVEKAPREREQRKQTLNWIFLKGRWAGVLTDGADESPYHAAAPPKHLPLTLPVVRTGIRYPDSLSDSVVAYAHSI